MKKAFIQWLANGERGISSNTIATRLSGIDCMPKNWRKDHPHDPADFLRCEKLLDAVPEFRDRLSEMQAESPVWKALYLRWDDIKETIECDLEATDGKRVTNAYVLMKDIIKGASDDSKSVENDDV